MSRFFALLRNAARLRCPACREGRIFEGLIRKRTCCEACGSPFEREPGYYVGAIYLNYGATVGISIAGFFALDAWLAASLRTQLLLWGAFCIVFPFFFYRFSCSLWLNADHFISGRPDA
ncbi:MAG: DUF983 domain-containing protein [bacterium]|nr:DUF983 domain-containing protein [bacterium]